MERKLGDTFFFPTVFRVVILICEKKVRGGGLAWSDFSGEPLSQLGLL